jgi:hypothetical protein
MGNANESQQLKLKVDTFSYNIQLVTLMATQVGLVKVSKPSGPL